MLRRFLNNNYSLNVINKIYTCLIGIITTAFITRYLGLGLKGEYAFILQIVNLLMIFLDFGINQSYSYFYKSNQGKVLKVYLDLYMLQLLIYAVICFPLAGIFRGDETLVGVLILIPMSVMCRQLESTMAVENIRLKIMMHMVNATLKLGLAAVMFFARDLIGVHVIYPVLTIFAIDLFTVVIYIFALKYRPCIKIDPAFVKKILAYSWLPMLTSALITVNYSVDVFFLKHMGVAEQLSIYTTAAGIINYVWLIPDAFKEVLVSKVARTNDVRPVNKALQMSVLCVLAICIGFIFLGKQFIQILYGADFLPSYGITLILIIGCFSMVFYKIIGVLMLAEGKRVFYFAALFASAVLNIIGNALMIPKYGMYGAAWVSVASYTMCGIVFLLYYMKTKNVKAMDLIDIRRLK